MLSAILILAILPLCINNEATITSTKLSVIHNIYYAFIILTYYILAWFGL